MDKYSIGFFGDFTTGENYQAKYDLQNRVNILRQKGYKYLFQHVEKLLNSFDSNIFNLETPLTDAKTSSLEHKKAVLHWADKRIVPQLLKDYKVEAVSLGNNHAMDYDKQGLNETLNLLREKEIYPFGAGLNENNASRPFIKHINLENRQINLYVFGGFKYKQEYDTELNYYAKQQKEGVFLLTPETVSSTISAIKENDKNSVIVVFPHFGFDLLKTTPMQREYAHGFIDAGADYVIGHGPHMINSMEIYNGKPILYGIGNFIFPADFKGKTIPYNLAVGIEFSNEQDKLYLYPTFMENQELAPITRFISNEELPEVMKLLTEDSPELLNNLKTDIINGIIRIEV